MSKRTPPKYSVTILMTADQILECAENARITVQYNHESCQDEFEADFDLPEVAGFEVDDFTDAAFDAVALELYHRHKRY